MENMPYREGLMTAVRAVETAAAVRGVRHVSTDVVVEPAKS